MIQYFELPSHRIVSSARARGAACRQPQLSHQVSPSLEVTESVVADRGAAHAILSQADGDLVVMSTHGRTGFDRVLFGSVADKVIRGTTGAVLVIPPHTRAPQ